MPKKAGTKRKAEESVDKKEKKTTPTKSPKKTTEAKGSAEKAKKAAVISREDFLEHAESIKGTSIFTSIAITITAITRSEV